MGASPQLFSPISRTPLSTCSFVGAGVVGVGGGEVRPPPFPLEGRPGRPRPQYQAFREAQPGHPPPLSPMEAPPP